MAMTETWLRPDLPNDLYSIPGYNLIRHDRVSRAGGVAFFVSEKLTCSVIDRNISDNMEYLLIKICLKHHSLGLATVYRPDNRSYSNLNCLSDIVASFYSCNVEGFIILGDFNVNLLGCQPSSEFLKELLDQHSCVQLVDKPTRVTESSESLLDLVITNIVDGRVSADVSDFCLSDHNAVLCSYNTSCKKPDTIYKPMRCFRSFNLEQFLEEASAIDWNCVYLLDSLEDKVDTFNACLLNLFDKYAPLQLIAVNNNRPKSPWFTDTLRILKRKKRRAWLRFVRTGTQSDRRLYCTLRNYYNGALLHEKRAYFSSHIEANKYNSRRLWQNFRRWNMTSTSTRAGPLPEHLWDPDLINDHFTTPPAEQPNDTPIDLDGVSSLNHTAGFVFHLPGMDEIRSGILRLKPNVIGPDGISGRMLQLSVPFIVPPLTHIINTSFERGSLPQQWKVSSTFPIIKASKRDKDAASLTDLRPITLLSNGLRVAEYVLYSQLTDYVEEHNLLPPAQSGFRRGYSTTSALCSTLDDIVTAVDLGQLTYLTLLDMSKAFDSVNFSLLSGKLRRLGISGSTLQWISSYLNGRSQFTTITTPQGSLRSECKPISSGVPQGSTLGPLLFSIYIADLPDSVHHSSVQLFADDIQLYISFAPHDEQSALQKINSDLSNIVAWTYDNCLVLNPNKCQSILLGSRHARSQAGDLNVTVGGVAIPLCDTVRNLGVVLDSGLTFTNNVSLLCRRAYFRLKQLLPFKLLLDRQTKLLLCESLVLSILNYGDLIYGPFVTLADNHRLQKIQNLCARFITPIPRFAHVTPYIRDLGCLKMQERRLLHYAVFLGRIILSERPSYLYNKIVRRSSLHDRNLRHVDNTLDIPNHSCSFFKCSFSYLSAYIYNNVLNKIPSSSAASIKKALKEWIITGDLEHKVDLSLF